jgi:hypothetical protein
MTGKFRLLLRPRAEPGWMVFSPQGKRLRVAHLQPGSPKPRLRWT